ncbi:TnsD family Tn7-like transposition protein [Dankookia rubra]|nr:TnsD family Tn7-like transposition protein [Dankookia rubra]
MAEAFGKWLIPADVESDLGWLSFVGRNMWSELWSTAQHIHARHPVRYIMLLAFIGVSPGAFFAQCRDLQRHSPEVAPKVTVFRNAGVTTEVYKERLRVFLAAHAGSTRTQTWRRLGYACCILRHRDPEWLSAALPMPVRRTASSRRRVDWVNRDCEYLGRARTAIEAIRNKSGKPRRLSVYSIYEEMGVSRKMQRFRERLPQTTSCISGALEGNKDWFRRLGRWKFINTTVKSGRMPTLVEWKNHLIPQYSLKPDIRQMLDELYVALSGECVEFFSSRRATAPTSEQQVFK